MTNYLLKTTYLVFTISLVLLFCCIYPLDTYAQDSVSRGFDYSFNKSQVEVDSMIKLNVFIDMEEVRPHFMKINRDSFYRSVFLIKALNFSSRQVYDLSSNSVTRYCMNISIGVDVDKLRKYGSYNIPAIEIKMYSSYEASHVKEFIIPEQEIKVVAPSRINMLILVLIIFPVILLLFVVVFLLRKHKLKVNKQIEHNKESLYTNTKDRFSRLLYDYRTGKDKDEFLSSARNLAQSYLLRKYKMVNLDSAYDSNKIPTSEKIQLRDLLSSIELFYKSGDNEIKNSDLDLLEIEFNDLIEY